MRRLVFVHLSAVTAVLSVSILVSGCSNTLPSTTTDTSTQEAKISETTMADTPLIVSIEAIDDQASSANATVLEFSVRNTGIEPVEWLVWNTPFESPLSADIFDVQLDGVDKDYQGRLVKRGEPEAQHFITVPAGESIDVAIDLANYYDMSQRGVYTVQLDHQKVMAARTAEHQKLISAQSTAIVLNVP